MSKRTKTTEETVEQFIARTGITFQCVRTDDNPHWTMFDGDHWLVTLKLGRRKLETVYSLLIAHEGRKPTASEVLICLVIDALTISEYTSYKAWYNEHERANDKHARALYASMRDARKRLVTFLGNDGYTTLINNREVIEG